MNMWATCGGSEMIFRVRLLNAVSETSPMLRECTCAFWEFQRTCPSAYSYQRRSRVGLVGMFVARQATTCFDRENVGLQQPSSLNRDVRRSRSLLEGGPSRSPGPHWLVYFVQTPLDAREASARALCSALHAFTNKPRPPGRARVWMVDG